MVSTRVVLQTLAFGGALLLLLYVAVRRLGLAPHDVLLVCAVGSYASFERWRGRGSSGEGAPLLG